MIEAGAEAALSEGQARELIAAQFGDLRLAPVRALGQGEDFAVFECSGLAFRFPRRAESAVWMETEIRVLPAVASLSAVAVPRYERIGRPGPGFPLLFGGYPLLSGHAASLSPPSLLLAADVGRFLSALHGMDPTALDLPRETGLWAPHAYRARACTEAGPNLSGLPRSLRNACLAFLESDDEPKGAVGLTLIHGDLEGEHLFVDSQARLTGVIDWSDICVSDPARDLGGLWAWGGEAFLSEILRHYEPPLDPGFLDRVRFLGRCFALFDYVEAGEDGHQALAYRQLTTAFGEAA